MIKLLHNPKTKDYCDFKRWVLSPEFAWHYNGASTPDIKNSTHTDLPFYTHTFLGRPESDFYSRVHNSEEVHGVVQILKNILDCNEPAPINGVQITFVRSCINTTPSFAVLAVTSKCNAYALSPGSIALVILCSTFPTSKYVAAYFNH